MIDVLEKPVAAPPPSGQGQRRPTKNFDSFLGSCLLVGGEANDSACLPHDQNSQLAAAASSAADSIGEQRGGLDAGGHVSDMDGMPSGITDPNSWPVDDAAVVSLSQQPETGELRHINGEKPDGNICIDGSMGNLGSEPVRESLRVQVQAGQGCEEWIFRPWRLQAGAGLSYRGENSMQCRMEESALSFALNGIDTGRSTVQFVRSDEAPASSTVQKMPLACSARGVPIFADASDGAAGADPLSPTNAGSLKRGVWIHWAQRMLRWNAGAGEGEDSTAWVRDFSLEADEMPSLVASLRSFSAGQGISLGRIMVNGREAWAAAGYSQHMERNGNGR